ncbi:MAG: hypothetical protein HYW47_04395 [Deltaproteobacteria bacterium]|nr:hypothetical protein [Deltaproteobacteria bacterium]
MKRLFLSVLFLLSFSSLRAESQDVYVGIFLNDVINVDLRTNTYIFDFYLWFRWQGEKDPSDSFEFINASDTWSHTWEKTYETPKLIHGWKYQSLHINGNFHHPFFLGSYPLDEQDLVVGIEDVTSNQEGIRYIADVENTSYRKDINMPSWNILNHSIVAAPYTYPTSFGDPQNLEKPDRYSRVTFKVRISRNKQLYLFKMLLPILIVLLCTFILFLINPEYSDARLALAITALVSAVALHITVSGDLPQVGYLVLIDKIYNLCYFAIFLALAETVYTTYLKDKGLIVRAKKLDKISFVGLLVLFLTMCVYLTSYA